MFHDRHWRNGYEGPMSEQEFVSDKAAFDALLSEYAERVAAAKVAEARAELFVSGKQVMEHYGATGGPSVSQHQTCDICGAPMERGSLVCLECVKATEGEPKRKRPQHQERGNE